MFKMYGDTAFPLHSGTTNDSTKDSSASSDRNGPFTGTFLTVYQETNYLLQSFLFHCSQTAMLFLISAMMFGWFQIFF
jgi:hypothetical protein